MLIELRFKEYNIFYKSRVEDLSWITNEVLKQWYFKTGNVVTLSIKITTKRSRYTIICKTPVILIVVFSFHPPLICQFFRIPQIQTIVYLMIAICIRMYVAPPYMWYPSIIFMKHDNTQVTFNNESNNYGNNRNRYNHNNNNNNYH